MGTAYDIFGSKGRTMVPIETSGLKRGQVVSYGDMANPRQRAVVVEAEGSTYGQRCVFVDGLTWSKVSIASIEGPGGWHLHEGEVWTDDETHALEKLAEAAQAQRVADQRAKEEERKATIAKGKELAETMVPAWARAYIIAEHELDDCDTMTDYFNTKTDEKMLLGFSRHTRDLFTELRKFAALYGETKHLATAGPDAEHREKYSMGAGYYLKAGSTYGTGWKVHKYTMGRYNDGDVALLLGSGCYLPALERPGETRATASGTVTINEQLNGVEIHFPDKPSEETRERLKQAGFRWSRAQGLWYARRSDKTEAAAREIVG